MLRTVISVLNDQENKIRKLEKELKEVRQQIRYKKVTINDMRYSKKVLYEEIKRLESINKTG